MQKIYLLLILAVCFLLAVPSVYSQERDVTIKINDVKNIRKQLGLSEYEKSENLSDVKIAVLDSGFSGFTEYNGEADSKRYLPKNTKLISTYKSVNPAIPLNPNDAHGRHMAQIVWAMAGYHEEGPQFHLYNARGPENFVAAVKEAIAWKADIILCSRNWQYFGDFAGGGFIDEAVRNATDRRIIWINAAGNFGGMVYNGVTRLDEEEEFVNFGSKDYPIKYLRFKNLADENDVTISLAWGDSDSATEGSDQDLDLFLYRGLPDKEEGFPVKIAAGESRQVKKVPNAEKNETLFTREIITETLRGYKDRYYYVAVKRHGGKFSAKDRIRVSLSGSKQPSVDPKTGEKSPALEFLSASDFGEIGVPADGSGVAVGDFTKASAKGPTRDGRAKPEFLFELNNVTFSDNTGYYGSSYAAAYLAGVTAVLKAEQPRLRQHHLLKFGTLAENLLWNEPKNSYFYATHPAVHNALRAHLGEDYVWRAKDGMHEVGIFKALPTSLTQLLSDFPTDGKEYDLYFRSETVAGRWRRVQAPGRYERGPDEKVHVPGHYVTPTYYQGPYTKTIPGKTRWVEGETFWVQDPTTYALHFCAGPVDKEPCWKKADGGKHEKTMWVRFMHLKEGKAAALTPLNKGSRVWKTPTQEQLKAAVEEK